VSLLTIGNQDWNQKLDDAYERICKQVDFQGDVFQVSWYYRNIRTVEERNSELIRAFVTGHYPRFHQYQGNYFSGKLYIK